jgi:LemA protein
MGSTIYILVAALVVVLAAAKLYSSLLDLLREVREAYLRLNTALRERTEAVMELLKQIKDPFKASEPLYEQALAKMKATLTAEGVAAVAAEESELGEILVKLFDKIVQRDETKERARAREAVKTICKLDKIIQIYCSEYNQAASKYNAKIGSFPHNLPASLLKVPKQVQFKYTCAPLPHH